MGLDADSYDTRELSHTCLSAINKVVDVRPYVHHYRTSMASAEQRYRLRQIIGEYNDLGIGLLEYPNFMTVKKAEEQYPIKGDPRWSYYCHWYALPGPANREVVRAYCEHLMEDRGFTRWQVALLIGYWRSLEPPPKIER